MFQNYTHHDNTQGEPQADKRKPLFLSNTEHSMDAFVFLCNYNLMKI